MGNFFNISISLKIFEKYFARINVHDILQPSVTRHHDGRPQAVCFIIIETRWPDEFANLAIYWFILQKHTYTRHQFVWVKPEKVRIVEFSV